MSYLKVFAALWTSIVFYSLASFLVGSTGLLAMERLRAERDRVSANLDELERINGALGGELDALRYDPDTLSVYARELGYGHTDERFIRIVGVPGSGKKRVSAGNLIVSQQPVAIPTRTLRIVSLLVGVAVFIVLTFTGKRRRA